MIEVAILGIWLWEFISKPFGEVSIPTEYRDGEIQAQINVSNFLIPRQVRTRGFLLPGGDFGFIRDPHYRHTNVTKYSFEIAYEEPADWFVRVIDVNYLFDQKFRKNFLILKKNEEPYFLKLMEFHLFLLPVISHRNWLA